MKCGFEEKECTDKCSYFNTCARNPYRKKKEGVTLPHSEHKPIYHRADNSATHR